MTLRLASLRRGPRRRRAPDHDGREALRDAVSSVVILDEASPREPDPRGRMRRIAAEAVVLQDEAEAVLAAIARCEPLGHVAPRGGPLASRFFELRLEVPSPTDAELARGCETLRTLLDHHGTMLTWALHLLAGEWRSPAVREQLERIDGLGEPAARLDALYAELARDA